MPVHLQPYYRDLTCDEEAYPEAEKHGREAISLPLYPALTEPEQERITLALRKALEK